MRISNMIINKFSKKFLVMCALVIAVSCPVFADTVTFNSASGMESLLLSENAGWYPRGLSPNYYLVIGTQVGEQDPNLVVGPKSRRRELLRFDVSALDGLYGSIDSVQLYLRYSTNATGADTDFDISIAKVAAANADWKLLEATWRNKDQDYENEALDTVPWAGGNGLAQAGVDYNTPVAGSFTYNHTLQGTGTEIYVPLSTSTVIDWIEDPNSNGGLVLFGGEDINDNCSQFCGLNIPGSAPMLIVTYTIAPEPVPPQFYTGWYDLITGSGLDESGTVIVPYTYSAAYNPYSSIGSYLGAAAVAGEKVILALYNMTDVADQNTAAMRNFVSTFEGNQVIGWFTEQLPWEQSISVGVCQTAYNAIKMESDKPVFLTFGQGAIADGAPVDYNSAYDIMVTELYSCPSFTSEFAWIGDFKTTLSQTKAQVAEVGKVWWSGIQGFGEESTPSGFRFPTYREERFMAYYSVLEGAQGLLSWAHYHVVSDACNPSEPYPYSGNQWVNDVWEPITEELNALSFALPWPVENSVNESNADVNACVYRNPDTDEYFLVAVNTNSGSETVSFSIDVPGTRQAAVPLNESRSPINIQSGQFADSFSDYEVHVYKLPATCQEVWMSPFTGDKADVNKDCKVDFKDFAELAEDWSLCYDPDTDNCP